MSAPLIMVDDNLIDTRMVRRALSHSKLEIQFLSFPSGELFWEHVEQIQKGRQPEPALVLLDINMPGMGGFDVLRRIRDSRLLAATPIIMFSHSDREADRLRAQELGATFHEKFSEREAAVRFLESAVAP